jgi:CheY-like chemotaxis protein
VVDDNMDAATSLAEVLRLDGQDIQTAHSAGFDAHLVKPQALDGLRQVISDGLQPRATEN